MTHAELVERGARWLRYTKGCRVVLKEITSRARETPDVIGWRGCSTVLVECKISRADFHHDSKKLFRIDSSKGMGFKRFYLTPPGLLKVEDLPEMWGLIEAHKRCVRVLRVSAQFRARNTGAEFAVLQSELALYQLVLNGGELMRSGRAERIYRELGRQTPWETTHVGYWQGTAGDGI